MQKRWLIFLMALCITLPWFFADEAVSAGTTYDRWPSALGYYANSEGGVGLSWQRWFEDFGLAVAAGGVYNEDAGTYEGGYSEVLLDYNVQVRLSWILHAVDYRPWLSTNLQGLVYLAHRGITELQYAWYDEITFEAFYTRLPFRAELMAGAGVAAETTLFEHLTQTVDFMYIAKWPLELAVAGAWSFRFRY